MVRRTCKILGEIAFAVLVLCAVALFGASFYIDSDEFENRFLAMVEDVAGAPISLTGELDIALYPALSLKVSGLVVGGPPEFGDDPLAELETLYVSIRLLPLLDNRVDVKSVLVEGITINIIESAEGKLNWESLINKQAEHIENEGKSDTSIREIRLSGIEISDTVINYKDLEDGDKFQLSGIEFSAENFTEDKTVPFEVKSLFSWPSHGVEAKLSLNGLFGLSAEFGGLQIDNAKLKTVLGGEFLPKGAEPAIMTTDVDFDWQTQSVSMENVYLRFLDIEGSGALKTGNLDKAITAEGRLEIKQFKPSEIIAKYAPTMPVTDVVGLEDFQFSSYFSLSDKGVDLKQMIVVLDDQTVQGDMAMKDFSKPAFYFNLQGNKLDLDRYIPLFRSGTPFIWDDYPLELARAFKGRGVAQLGEFKVVDIVLKDIQATADATKDTLVFDAKALSADNVSMTGQAEMVIGTNDATGDPTFASTLSISGISSSEGFNIIQGKDISITGKGRARLALKVTPLDCPPEGRSMDLLNHLSGDVLLVLGEGKMSYQKEKSSHSVGYKGAEYSLKFSPASVKGGDYAFNTEFSLRGNGGDTVRAFSLSTKGPIGLFFDKLHAFSLGLQFRATAGGKLFTDHSSRITTNGLFAFDTEKHTLSLSDTTFRTLETTVRGGVQLTNLHESFKGTGTIEIPRANARRIAYLVNRFTFKTRDTEALKAISAKANVSLDKTGFKLTKVNGEVDGVPYFGQVVGKGYDNPRLLFELQAGKFNLDRYLPPKKKANQSEKSEPVKMPFKFLRLLNLSGTSKFEEFKFFDIRSTDFAGNIEAKDGKIHLSQLRGTMYKGQLTGDWSGVVEENSLSTKLKLNVKNMESGSFMIDLARRDYLRGRAAVSIDLTSNGRTDEDMVGNMNGRASLNVSKGSYKLSGYPKDDGKPLTEKEKTHLKQRTSFNRSNVALNVRQGVLNVDTFRIDSAVMQSYGKGWINLPSFKIDLTIKNDIVAVPSVTVRVVGDLGNPEIKVPTEKIVSDTVFNVLSLPKKSFNLFRDIFE